MINQLNKKHYQRKRCLKSLKSKRISKLKVFQKYLVRQLLFITLNNSNWKCWYRLLKMKTLCLIKLELKLRILIYKWPIQGWKKMKISKILLRLHKLRFKSFKSKLLKKLKLLRKTTWVWILIALSRLIQLKKQKNLIEINISSSDFY